VEGPFLLALTPPQTIVAVASPLALFAGDVEVDALVSPAIVVFFRGRIRCLDDVTGSLDGLDRGGLWLGWSDSTASLVLARVLPQAAAHRGFTLHRGALRQIDGLIA
jgi:hypothetical protein